MDVFTNYEITVDNYFKQNDYDIIVVGKGNYRTRTLINYVPSGFDIETTTQYIKNKKGRVLSHYTNMYIWQFGFSHITFFGRTWEDFSTLLKSIEKHIKKENKFIFFIHNMSFESAFMLKELEQFGHTVGVFARTSRHPLRIDIDDKFIVLDSALLSGYTLEKLADNYTDTKKLVGDLDYTLPRNKYTVLTQDELNYCRNDVRILVEYAELYKEDYLLKDFLPLTATMIASRCVKEKITELKAFKEKYYLINKIYPRSQGQYDYLMSFFSGAYVHGYIRALFRTIYDVLSFDVTSEYPYVLMSRYYPMGKWRSIPESVLTSDSINKYLSTYCCLVNVTFTNIRTKTGVTILSANKVSVSGEATWDNGRLFDIKGTCRASLTEVDLQTLALHYTWDSITYDRGIYTKRGKLPKYYRLALAELYAKKSVLKGIEEKKQEYDKSKRDLNGQYGALVTTLTINEIVWIEGKGWDTVPQANDFDKLRKTKNTSPSWGIYCTSWARNLILDSIARLDKYDPDGEGIINSYIYSDTDSLKVVNSEYVLQMFKDINEEIISNNKDWIEELELETLYPDVDFYSMGTFENENEKDGVIYPYKRFKTLGSKRYISETHDGKIKETISGLPKGSFANYCKKHKKDPFKTFSPSGIRLTEEECSKLCSYYMDEPQQFTVTDYQGNTEEIVTQSYVSLIPTTFNLSVSESLQALRELVCKQEGLKM